MTFWKPQPNFTFGKIAAYVNNKKGPDGKQQPHVLLFREYEDKNGKNALSHEFELNDLPAIRILLDDIYASLQRTKGKKS